MSSSSHNPEKRVWKGRSYRKGGERISELKIKAFKEEDLLEPSEGVKELLITKEIANNRINRMEKKMLI